MNLLAAFSPQTNQIRTLSRPAKLFLLTILCDGLFFSGWNLFFNLYILAAGYSREFLGMVNAAPSVAALLFSVPMGLLSDRMGRKRAMLLGFTLGTITPLMLALVHQPALMLVMAFLWGIAGQLYLLSQAPFMMKVSDDTNRVLLFSLSFGMFPLASALGNALAGQLPGVFSRLFGLESGSAAAYQAVLVTSLISSLAALIPLGLIHEPRTEFQTETSLNPARPKRSVLFILIRPLTLKLSLPNLMLGFGAAMLIPYMNVFFAERHHLNDQALGWLFSLSSLLIGVASFIAPRLVGNLGGKVRMVVVGQSVSLAFLLMLGFSPLAWLAVIGFLVRGTLMNMVAPLFDAFTMEQTPAAEQGAVNSMRGLAWNVGWAIGPYISGVVQARHGFAPLFIATAILYGLANMLTWIFFRTISREPKQPAVIAQENL